MRVAAIDVGTNSVKLSVGEVNPQGVVAHLDRRRINLQIGRRLEREERLGRGTIDMVATTVATLCQYAVSQGAVRISIVGTSAPREAADAGELCEAVHAASGHPMRIISGVEEATLTWEALASQQTLKGSTAVVDVGGGSTEVTLAQDLTVGLIRSLPIGAVRLTDRFETAGRVPPARLAELEGAIQELLDAEIPQELEGPNHVFVTGGTVTALALLDQRGMPLPDESDLAVEAIDGHVLRADFIHTISRRLAQWDRHERESRAGFSPLRAEVIVAGAVILDRVLTHLGAPTCELHELGIRDGLMLRLAAEQDQPCQNGRD